jgi:hypothetical protein
MTHPAAIARLAKEFGLAKEFDGFLFASIGLDRNELPLRVVSALARLDLDPWREASELDRMPREAATDRLALLLGRLPEGPLMHQAPAMIAGRLVALLPEHLRSEDPSSAASFGASAGTNSRAALCGFLVLMAVMMAAQVFMASQLPQQQLDMATPASRAVATMVSPPNPGQ